MSESSSSYSQQHPSPQEVLSWGRAVLSIEAASLTAAGDRLDASFSGAVSAILRCRGKVLLTGLGKSGHVCAKVASTLSSTGTPALFLHPGEALHGDFGAVGSEDLLLAVAHGGETREVLAVARFAKKLGLVVVAITGKASSSLAVLADHVLDSYVIEEADALGLAPTSSSTLALSLGDALAVSLMRARGFTEESFARLHPGGQLGRRLALARDFMHPLSELNALKEEDSFHRALETVTSPNFGIAPVLCKNDRLLGCITDGDLRRALLKKEGAALSLLAGEFMHKTPKVISGETKAIDAISLMEKEKITSLFVVEDDGGLLGLVRIHDLLTAKVI